MKTLLTMGIALLTALFCGCKEQAKVTSITPDDFEKLIMDEQVQLVDVRTPAEYLDGHLSCALNINVLGDDFSTRVEEQLTIDRPVAVYCKSGRRSKKAALQLQEAGYQVYDLDDGIQGWMKAGKPVVK